MYMRNRRSSFSWAVFAAVVLILLAITSGILIFMKKNRNKALFNADLNRDYVAVIGKSESSSFWISVSSGARAAAAEYNLDMRFMAPDSEEDYVSQNKMIGDAIADGAKAIIFSAIDYNANASAINRAIEAGIPVVVIDSDVNSAGVSCRIMTDNYEAGRMAGLRALENNDGKLVIGVVNYDINSANGQERERGFCDVIRESGRDCDIYTINCSSTKEDAYAGTCRLLEEHSDINTIAALNELMSLGSGYAIRDLGLEEEVDIYAFDSNVISVGMLETGEIDGLVVQNPYSMGYLGVETAYQLINGIHLPSDRIDTTTTYVNYANMYDIDIQRMIFRFDE